MGGPRLLCYVEKLFSVLCLQTFRTLAFYVVDNSIMWKTAKIFNFWNTLEDCASNMNCSNIEVINLKFNVCIARQSMLITSRILQCVENNDMTSSTLINIRMVVPGMEVSASPLPRIVLLLFPLHCNDWTMCRLPGPNLPCLLPPPPEPQPSASPVPHSCNLSVQTLSLWAGASDWGSPYHVDMSCRTMIDR